MPTLGKCWEPDKGTTELSNALLASDSVVMCKDGEEGAYSPTSQLVF